MSLRYQINLRVFFAALLVMLIGNSIAIWQARSAVKEEVESSINLAVQLITFSFSQIPGSVLPQDTEWLAKFQTLRATRHLTIQLQDTKGQLLGLSPQKSPVSEQNLPPEWFVYLVLDHYPKVERNIIGFNEQPLKIIIEANPLDEITEAWHETISFFLSLLSLTIFIFIAVNMAFAKALKSIAIIVEALQTIETGDYSQKLPEFVIKEYDSIARAINHMTDELNKSQVENRALTQHSLMIQEDERQRLSQELHDELGQYLTAIKVMAVTAKNTKANTGDIMQQIVAICDHLMTVVRYMMQQLHPLTLSELGLKAALEDLLQHWSRRNPELDISMTCPDEIDYLDKNITIQLFRITQEGLTNIVRHAEAKHAHIDLVLNELADGTEHSEQTFLCLTISDDGQGCVIEEVKRGFGLLSIRERVTSLDGKFSINSAPQQGMQILATIPL